MASIEYVVNATDAASAVFQKIGLSADHLDQQLQDLSKRVATPEVDLEDSKFTLGMIKAAERLDKLSAKIADPKVEVDAAHAQLEILKINAQLDRLDAKRVTATVEVKTDRSFLSRLGGGGGGWLSGLLGGGGAVAGGAASGAGGAAGGGGDWTSALKGVGIGGLIATAAALGPALLPLGLGALVGGGATAGAFALGNKANKQLQALGKSLQSAQAARVAAASPRTRRAAEQRIQDVQGQMRSLRQTYGPELAISGAFQDLGMSVKDTFAGALKSTGTGFSGAGPNQSFMTSLEGILKQISGFVKSIGPQLGDMFRATIPFLQLFVKGLEQAAKILLPVFTQSLRQMQPFLPLISQGLMALVQGLADMIKAMGPRGMEASAKTFVALMKAVGGILTVTGKAVNFFAIAVQDVAHWLQQHWKVVEWLAAPVVTAVTLIIRHWNDFRHNTAVIFDGIRHDVAHYWDVIYNNSIGAVINLVNKVNDWFHKLPGRVVDALAGLGSKLWHLGATWLTDMWNGIKSVWSHVVGFFENIPGDILHALGIHSPPDWAIEAGKHIMDGLHIGLAGTFGKITSFFSGIPRGLGAGLKGAPEGIAAAMLPAFGWSPAQMAPLVQLWNRESGWRWNARNPTSGAYGIPQALPASKMAAAGPDWLTNPATQIRWGLSYIKGRYGTPAGAWAHELQFGWYDRGGWLPPGLSLALNQTGRPERVGGGAGNTYNINVRVDASTNPADTGRVIVERILQFEKRSGAGWRR